MNYLPSPSALGFLRDNHHLISPWMYTQAQFKARQLAYEQYQWAKYTPKAVNEPSTLLNIAGSTGADPGSGALARVPSGLP